ncbi:hypothetical protein MMPV_009211 [Pyropia vietnamensis]
MWWQTPPPPASQPSRLTPIEAVLLDEPSTNEPTILAALTVAAPADVAAACADAADLAAVLVRRAAAEPRLWEIPPPAGTRRPVWLRARERGDGAADVASGEGEAAAAALAAVVAAHVTLHPPGVPPGGLSAALARLGSETLPRDRPLWHLDLFPGVALPGVEVGSVGGGGVGDGSRDADGGGGSGGGGGGDAEESDAGAGDAGGGGGGETPLVGAITCVLRVHHAVADGVSLVKFLLLGLVDNDDDDMGSDTTGVAARRTARLARLLPMPSRHRTAGGDGATAPASFPFRAAAWVRAAFAAAAAVGRVFVATLIMPDPPTALNTARLTGVKTVAIRALPLEPLKAAAARLPGHPTINDLAAAALAGAVRAYLGGVAGDGDGRSGDGASAASPPLPAELHVGMPFSLHPPVPPLLPPGGVASGGDHAAAHGLLSNHFALLAAPLPIGEPTLAGRLAATTGAYKALKRGVEPALTAAAFSLLGTLPARLRTSLWARLTRRASLTFSNVAGPKVGVCVAGRQVTAVGFLVPTAGQVRASVSLFSYAGCVTLGVYGDAATLPAGKAEALADALIENFDALVGLAGEGEDEVGESAPTGAARVSQAFRTREMKGVTDNATAETRPRPEPR